MNISKYEQRVLHALAQGGRIVHRWDDADKRIVAIDCFTREGHRLADCSLALFRRLRRRALIASMGGQPYRITRLGLAAVRAQLDNR
ncbi:YjhX family toxin [Sphingomonas sp.]|uniref:YjhX family toxin n=1 Tax=Sphingomonas sp. TaxID=28214 RepID=UPI003D6CA122